MKKLRLRKAIISLIILLILACLTYGIITYRDYSALANSDMYADGPISIDAHIPPVVHSYNRLKANPFAVQIFMRLEKNGTSEGKMYALTALKIADIDYFNSLEAKYQASNEMAHCIIGCIMSDTYLRDLFEHQ